MTAPAAEALRRRYAAAEKDRMDREAHWHELLNFVAPSKLTYEESLKGGSEGTADSRERRLFDSTAPESLVLFQSFLFSDVFVGGNATAESLTFEPLSDDGSADTALMQNYEVQGYLDHLARQCRTALWAGEINAVAAIQDACSDLGWCGTAVYAALENTHQFRRAEYPIIFKRYSPFQAAGEVGPDGTTSAFYIKEELTLRQARMRWPEHDFKGQGEETREFVFSVCDSTDPETEAMFGAKALAMDLPWAGGWFDLTKGERIQDFAYPEQPIFMPRWLTAKAQPTGVWGRGPASVALADIAGINALEDSTQRMVEKLVDPPMAVPDGQLIGPLRLYAGGLNYYDGERPPEPLLSAGSSRIEVAFEKLAAKQDAVRRAFMVHLMATPEKSGNPRTATEINQQEDWRNRAAAPMALRIAMEGYAPLVRRVLGLLARAGRLRPAPEVLRGRRLRPKFNSPVLASQAAMDAVGTMRLFESLAPWAQADATIIDNVDPDKVYSILRKGSGAPSMISRSPAAVKARRDERQEAAQAQAAQQQMVAGAEAAASLKAAGQ